MSQSNSGAHQGRQARLASFLSQLELPQENLRAEKAIPIEKLKFKNASLDDFLVGGSHDIASILTTLNLMGRHTPGESVMVDEAHQAIESLFEALGALDTARSAIRNFVRSYEPLVRYLASMSTTNDGEFHDRLQALLAEKQNKAKQQGWASPTGLDDLNLDELQRLLAPHWFSDAQPVPADYNTAVIKPKRSLTNTRQLRNMSAHRYLPSGVRLVPCLQETLVSLAALFGETGRISSLQRHLHNGDDKPFLISGYLNGIIKKHDSLRLNFLKHTVDAIPEILRRLKRNEPEPRRNQEQSTDIPDLLAFVLESRRVWLTGDGGEGKTVFLEQLARRAAASREHRLLPVLIPLHQFRPEHQNGQLQALVKSALNIRFTQPLPRLTGWTPVLLLDGFNELSVRIQKVLLRELADLELQWQSCRTWVSSRTTQRSGEWQTVSLRPWSSRQRQDFLERIAHRGKRLDIDSFQNALNRCYYREMVENNPLLFAMTSAYALAANAKDLPVSEGLIFRYVIDAFFRRENEKHFSERETDLGTVRETLGRLALLMFEQQAMTLSEDLVWQVLKQSTFNSGNPLNLLLEVGLIEREGDTYRFWHQNLRAYFIAEGLLKRFDEPASNDDTSIESEQESTPFEKVLKRLEGVIAQHIVPRLEHYEANRENDKKLSNQEKEQIFSPDSALVQMTELVSILHYYIDLTGAPARRSLAALVKRFPFEESLAYWWDGWGALLLGTLCRLNVAYPDERLLTTIDAMAIFRRGLNRGHSSAVPTLLMNALGECKLSDLAFQIARHVMLAPNLSLTEFTEGLNGPYDDEGLLRAMTFPFA